MDISQIKKLIQLLNDNNLGELKVQEGEFKITIRHRDFVNTHSSAYQNSSAYQPSVAQPQISIAAPTAESRKEETPTGNYSTIKAPMIGTFYRASSEGKEPFVKVGDKIKKVMYCASLKR